ncbi:spermidine synthase [Enterovirga sp. CN4-39]|uniref:spermine/spermidine synthase domain-containing protein n=1 Tax=Enterovirga sp. CN4-39 TaxID=3400910 RepID=UPI003C0418C7
MIPWIHLDTARIPGGGELRLMQRGTEFSIRLGQNELMNTRLFTSEEALAQLVCERLRTPRPQVLIGGLGMGFTLRAAEALLGPEAAITVAELVPAVVEWARGPLSGIFGDSLEDPRVTIHEGDVAALIRRSRQQWDAILLDVDNGPDGLTVEANDALYDHAGLGAARAALKSGGLLAVWSSGPDRHFTERLRRTGFAVEEVKVRARAGGGGGSRHVIWLARR